MDFHRQRVDNLWDTLRENNLDGLLVSTPENRRYLSGFADIEGLGYVLVALHGITLATEFHVTEAERATSGIQVVKAQGNFEWFPPLAVELGVSRLGFEADNLTVTLRDQLAHALDRLAELERRRVELEPTSGLVEGLRSLKDSVEMATIQRAVDITDKAFESVSRAIEPGWTEKELAWRLETAMRELGGEGLAFPTLVGSGPNSGFAGNVPGERVLSDGDPIIIDMGAMYQGYCSDLTRTVVVGEPDEKFRRLYNAVYDSQHNAIRKVRPGIKGGDIYDMLTRVLADAGFGEHAGPAFGHGIGLEVHEGSRIRFQHPGVFEAGMPFTIEPGIYIPDYGGARLEDIVVMDESGSTRVLSKAPKPERFAG